MNDCKDCQDKDQIIKILEIRVKVMTDLLDNLRAYVGISKGESILEGVMNLKPQPVIEKSESPVLEPTKKVARILSASDRRFLIDLGTELGLVFNNQSSYRILSFIEYKIKYEGIVLDVETMERVNKLYSLLSMCPASFE